MGLRTRRSLSSSFSSFSSSSASFFSASSASENIKDGRRQSASDCAEIHSESGLEGGGRWEEEEEISKQNKTKLWRNATSQRRINGQINRNQWHSALIPINQMERERWRHL